MNFNELMAKMRELDAPAPTQSIEPQTTECGDMPGPTGSSMSPSMPKPDAPPPSMSINLNAQGLDNIEELMKLIKQVNPDMGAPAANMPSMAPMPSISAMPPLKMLPDMDNEPDIEIDKPGPDIMNTPHSEPDGDEGPEIKGLDRDGDGDHDMDDHDAEKKKDKEEAFGNSVGDSEPETRGVDDVLMKGNDIHKPKGTYPKVAGGDNPMQRTHESTDLRSQIRAELLTRLEEAKKSYSAKAARAGKDIGKPGKEFAKIAKSAGEKYGSKERGEKVAGAVLAKLRKG